MIALNSRNERMTHDAVKPPPVRTYVPEEDGKTGGGCTMRGIWFPDCY